MIAIVCISTLTHKQGLTLSLICQASIHVPLQMQTSASRIVSTGYAYAACTCNTCTLTRSTKSSSQQYICANFINGYSYASRKAGHQLGDLPVPLLELCCRSYIACPGSEGIIIARFEYYNFLPALTILSGPKSIFDCMQLLVLIGYAASLLSATILLLGVITFMKSSIMCCCGHWRALHAG